MVKAKHWIYDYDVTHQLHVVVRIENGFYGVRYGSGKLQDGAAQDTADDIAARSPIPAEFVGKTVLGLSDRLLHDYVALCGFHPEEETLP